MKISTLALAGLSLGSVIVVGCVADPSATDEISPPAVPGEAIGHEHLMLTDQARAQLPDRASERAAQTLTYYGGPVVKNVTVYPLFWNSNVQYQSNISQFYSAVSTGQYMTFLSQYSAGGQTIGNGTHPNSYVDAQTATSLTDAQIQSYLASAFGRGLPAPTANTYYPIHFPAGVSITDSSGNRSCVQFCAYHGTFTYNGTMVYYGVLPDLSQAGCNGGCGGSSVLNNTTSVASHEFAETITDPGVGEATTYSYPLGWYNATYGEIGDICNGQQSTVTLGDGRSYVVQKLWSNKNSACVAP